jgi:DegV family protein with EDD domain
VLAIKPLLELLDGKIEPLDSVRTKKKAVARMLEIAEEMAGGKENVHAAVFHGLAEEEAKEIRGQVEELLSPVELLFGELSPAIGTHTGPGTVGMAFYIE